MIFLQKEPLEVGSAVYEATDIKVTEWAIAEVEQIRRGRYRYIVHDSDFFYQRIFESSDIGHTFFPNYADAHRKVEKEKKRGIRHEKPKRKT